MRLFLSSYRAGNYAERLVELFGEGCKVALISNAKDYKTADERNQSVADVMKFLQDLGFDVDELDLRKYFNSKQDWRKYLKNYGAIWLSGGNTFVLCRALAAAGLNDAITEMVHNDELAYGGESAGAILATPSFYGVEHGDDPDVLPEGYTAPTPWEGLGLVSYHIVPHFGTWDAAGQMINVLEAKDLQYVTSTDSEVMIVDGNKEEKLV